MKRQQRGGTFLGFVVGVVVGLGVALAVAVYVTRVPVPFLDKGTLRKADQDAAEALKNKDWDPNAPLYGRNPARAAASGVVSAPTPAAPGGAASAPPGPVAAPAAAPTPRASASAPVPLAVIGRPNPGAADPLGDLVRARSAATTATGTADPFSYFVQAGAFRTPEDAEAQRARLTLMGVDARVTEREQSGRMVYRVRMGPFDTREAADRVKERLDGGGIEAALVRVQR